MWIKLEDGNSINGDELLGMEMSGSEEECLLFGREPGGRSDTIMTGTHAECQQIHDALLGQMGKTAVMDVAAMVAGLRQGRGRQRQ
jgi:hypothetical protein